MRHYTCDVCKKEMPPGYERTGKKQDGLAAVCKLEDTCPECARIGHNIPVREILLEHWRKMIANPNLRPPAELDEELPEQGTELKAEANFGGFSGRGGAEKAAIHKRLMEFRGDPPRLGCLNELAAATREKVTADMLRQIIVDGASPSIDVWRIIGKALDTLEATHE